MFRFFFATPLSAARVSFAVDRWRILCSLLMAWLFCGSVLADEPKLSDYRKNLQAFTKLSKHESFEVKRHAAYNLCQLHHQLVFDSRFSSSRYLQGLRTSIANRLELIQQELERNALKQRRGNDPQRDDESSDRAALDFDFGGSSSGSSGGSGTSLVQDPIDSDSTDPAEGVPASVGDGEHPILGPADTDLDIGMYEAAYRSHDALNRLTGGPSQLLNHAGGQFAPPWDHGPELVALIEATIDPSFWRSAGGSGVIHYYQPSRVLVISASQEVHDKVYDLLFKLGARGG